MKLTRGVISMNRYHIALRLFLSRLIPQRHLTKQSASKIIDADAMQKVASSEYDGLFGNGIHIQKGTNPYRTK